MLEKYNIVILSNDILGEDNQQYKTFQIVLRIPHNKPSSKCQGFRPAPDPRLSDYKSLG